MEPVTFVIATLLVIFLSAVFYPKLRKENEKARIVNKIPGVRSYPLIGTTYEVFMSPQNKLFEVLERTWKLYPHIQRDWIGQDPEIRLSKAEYVEKIMCSTKHLEKSYTYDFIKPWLGDGLLIAKGGKWHKHRKLITPTFHFSILDGFCDIFAEQADVLVKKIAQFADTNKAIDVCPIVTLAALDIICETAMGTKINAQADTGSEYVAAIYRIGELTVHRAFRPWLHSAFIFNLSESGKTFKRSINTVHGFTNKIIDERIKARKNQKVHNNKDISTEDFGKKKRQAFLDLLLDATEQENSMSMEDLRAEVDTFMFEGHDTTTSGTTFALFCLGHNPKVQELIYEEMNAIFGGSDRLPTLKDLNEMKYLERVIKETMRMYPPVPFTGRITSEDVEIGGYMIPKDCYISLEIFKVMRDPDHFPNPEKFDPDRFLPENTANRHPYAYIPFSAGPRNCIGQKFALYEEKTLLSSIVRKFKIKSAQKPEELNLLIDLVLRSDSGLNLYFEKR